MITIAHPQALLLAPALAWVIWLWWRIPFQSQPGRWGSLVLRLLLLTALLLALAGPRIRLPQGRQAVVFVADLSASDAAQQSSMQDVIRSSLAKLPHDAQAGIVTVGREALVEQPVSPLSSFDGFQTKVNADGTNLQSGLELGGATLPDTYRHRVVLLSDGQPTTGDAVLAARLLRARGVRVDVIPFSGPTGPDVLVDAVTLPSQLHAGERFDVVVSLVATSTNTARLDLVRDRTLVASRQVRLLAGRNQFTFSQPPLPAGFHTYQVHISPAIDSQPQNNSGSASVSVQGTPRVLVIAATPAEAVNVLASLRSTGVSADLVTPVEVVPSLTYLARYAATVIVDTPAPALDPTFLDQLVPYVRDLGRGLVVIGGQQSFGVGGYGGTPLEKVLPVQMDLPQRKQYPTVAVALLIESLEAPMPVNISKIAGKGVVRLLTEQDQVAINDTPDSRSAGWSVLLQRAVNKAAIYHSIDKMRPGDPPSYARYLQEAFDAVRRTNARVKHILLLGDGDAVDRQYEALVRKIQAAGVTVSTVITNGDGPADFQTMRNIASWGGGRYYRADRVAAIPKIFLRETHTIARSGTVQGTFFPLKLADNPMLRDLSGAVPLTGYVATAPKPTSEIELVSKKRDPILASWQFGSGRAVAWTSDAAGLWTRAWLFAPGAGRFWSNVVGWTFPTAHAKDLYITTATSPGVGHISVQPPPTLGSHPDLVARVVDPALHVRTVHLQSLPAAGGLWAGYGATFAAPSQGAYFVSVVASGSGRGLQGQATLDVPYSAEYRTAGANIPYLHTLARAGGGSFISTPGDVWRDNLATVYDQSDLATWLWLLAALLLPADIAVRRLAVARGRRAVPVRSVSPAALRSGRGRSEQREKVTRRPVHSSARATTRGYPGQPEGRMASATATLSNRATVSESAGSQSTAPTVQTPPPLRASVRSPSVQDGTVRAMPGGNSGQGGDTTASRLLAAKRRRRQET